MAVTKNYTVIPNHAFRLNRNNKQNYKIKLEAIIRCELFVGRRPNPQSYPLLSSTWVQLRMTETELDNMDQDAYMKWWSCCRDHGMGSCQWCRNLPTLDQANKTINTLSWQIL